MTDSVMTEAQEAAWATINNSWPIATYSVKPDGRVHFICDDGDDGWIEQDGKWDWN